MAYARFAGVMYFFTTFDLTGVVIISRITGTGTFLATAHSIAASETLYRIGILFGRIGDLSTILLAIALYAILKPVDGILAMTALLFRLAESAIGGVVVVLAFADLQIYLDANRASALSANQLGVLADLMSRTSAAGTDVSVVCFSIGSAIFFYLLLGKPSRPTILGSASGYPRLADRDSRACRRSVALDPGNQDRTAGRPTLSYWALREAAALSAALK
jgi:hypothetical protein